MRIISVAIILFIYAPICLASGRFGQMVFSFDSERKISVQEFLSNSALEIHFSKTTPEELEKVNFYDDALVKRVLVTDLGPSGSKLKLYLRDGGLKASVSEYKQPYRVAIDIFDRNFQTKTDPSTGLPLITKNSARNSSDNQIELNYGRLAKKSKPQFYQPELSATLNNNQLRAGKRKLVAPTADNETIAVTTDFKEKMSQIIAGRGKSWKSLPYYMYPLQTAIYQGRANPSGFKKSLKENGYTEGQAMAEYGLKLFNFGHEKRSLAAYQQVLRKEPIVFDEDPLHLWALAEIHFGNGNLTLAGEYYNALISKHPASPLSSLSQVRLLDIKALYSINSGTLSSLKDLVPSLKRINPKGNSELALLLAVREAIWSSDLDHDKSDDIPKLTDNQYSFLSINYPNHESSQTGFLVASFIMNHLIDSVWNRDTSEFAKVYFEKFSGKKGKPFSNKLEKKLAKKLKKLLKNHAAEGRYLDAIETYESIPANIKSIQTDPKTSWALAESYRNIGKMQESLPFYEKTAKESDLGLDKIKSSLWSAIISGNLTNNLTGENLTPSKINNYKNKSSYFDTQVIRIWSKLNSTDQRKFTVGYKSILEENVLSPIVLKSPPKILLYQWTSALATNLDPTTTSNTQKVWQNNFSPSSSLVKFLSQLASRFTELGLEKERVQSISLMKKLKPRDFGSDSEAKLTWANELAQLADDYRKANRYLDAGRLYKEIAQKSENWQRKTESLYKGGLLLYRAGRKEEAISALKEASQDGSNLFYQNLAKERLIQLEQ